MSDNLKKCIQLLSTVSKIKKPKLQNAVWQDISCDEKVCSALGEISVNALKDKIPLTKVEKRKLAVQKPKLRSLVTNKYIDKKGKKRKLTQRRRRQLISQTGGAWSFLIPQVLSLLGLSLLK